MKRDLAPVTPEDLEALKRSWLNDPHWDIEETEGFEAYRDELLEYRKEMEEKWRQKEERRRHDEHVHHESRVVAWTDIVINRRRINVTAREGATAEDILQTCRALLEAVQTIENAYRKRAEAKNGDGQTDPEPEQED